MKYYLINGNRQLSKDGVNMTHSLSEAMIFYTWEDAYSYNCEYFEGRLTEASEEDL